MELMIALLLMTIVVAIAYMALSLTGKQLAGMQNHFSAANTYRSLQHALQEDMRKSNEVLWQEGSLLCAMSPDTASYSFQDSLIIREISSLATDSFKLHIDSAFFGFESLPQMQENELVDEVRLHLSIGKESFLIQQQKRYDAATLMHE